MSIETTFRNIAQIIERESKTSTYKFALLRSTIDVIAENSPFIQVIGDRVYMPVGALVEKWIFYYYAIFRDGIQSTQIHGKSVRLAFEKEFQPIVNFYEEDDRLGISRFYIDLHHDEIPFQIDAAFIKLVKKVRDTMKKHPMYYLGSSVTGEPHGIFRKEAGTSRLKADRLNFQWLLEANGTFSIPLEYYQAFRTLGSFISGQDSIVTKWASFSVNTKAVDLSHEKMLATMLSSPVTERDVQLSKRLYKELLAKRGDVYCVWSGTKVKSYDVDHVLPFAVWRNNDLWNLMPAKSSVNGKKSDKIPEPEFLETRKAFIFEYWNELQRSEGSRFEREIRTALLGPQDFSLEAAFNRLKENCHYLITTRGFEPWSYTA